MKHFNKLFVAAILFAGVTTQAQNADQPWTVTVGMNAIDGARVSAASKFENQMGQYFQTKNWSILPSASVLNVSRHLGGKFSFGLTGSVNKITKFIEPVYVNTGTNSRPNWVNTGQRDRVDVDLMYYGIDGHVKYNFIKDSWFDPAIFVGGGYEFVGKASAGTVGGGLSLGFWFTDNIGLTVSSTYKHSFDDSRTPNVDVASHLQHIAGVTFRFGGKDTDGDGVLDKYDDCPEVFGLKEFNGCPDTDGDGIIDELDECPFEFGLAEFNGCPDRDGDGIPDQQDACPDVPGLPQFNGCPDTDGDGVPDEKDECPLVPGPKENNGCPWPDRDGDGIPDNVDKCPDVPGLKEYNGCPKPKPTEQVVTEKLHNILFNLGKSTLRPESAAKLDEAADIIKNSPKENFVVIGMTDKTGTEAVNLKLSKERAAAVVKALEARGVNPEVLKSIGIGSQDATVPATASNEERQKDRKVIVRTISSDEFKVMKKNDLPAAKPAKKRK